MPVTITPATPKVKTNLSDQYNFCLDKDIYLEVTDAVAKFLKIKYTITYKGTTTTAEFLYAIVKNVCRVQIGKPVQPYVYLSEADIDAFFSNLKIDMQPADVAIELKLQNIEYEDLETFTLAAKFHAGYSSAIPADGSEVVRSLNFNTYLPLAYRFPTQNVDFVYKGKTKTYDKQAQSSALNIFQMMFVQQFHFADDSMVDAGFSSGFSSGFATADAIKNANPFFKYEEGYINRINSAYTIKGVNFPWQRNSLNIIWLNESNIFNSLTFTGDKTASREFTHYINSFSKEFRNRKAGSLSEKKVKINSGWKLASEISLFESLISSTRAWIFDKPENRKEISVTSTKIMEEDTARELIDFELEFSIDE